MISFGQIVVLLFLVLLLFGDFRIVLNRIISLFANFKAIFFKDSKKKDIDSSESTKKK